ncbi:putative metalloprotease CJM1_0395 family protein [Arsukibacterium sp.]|uniref:putative metalloprotease CJM1_0395 family protein n=1 Tax=Arsukibacterium sp. TaxID=1977258 RepID=UPI002FD9F569
MQLVSHYPNVSINTANPATESARRDMQRRELVEPVRELEKGRAEQAVATEDKARAPAATSSALNLYDSNGRDTETSQAIAGKGEQGKQEEQSQGEETEQQRQQAEQQQQAEQAQIRELQARDREVRSHEQAHATIGGRYAGAPSYTFQRGPDGQQYAVGGEVKIDISPEATPRATIQKMQQVKAAALAPAEPSSADRRIAAEAAQRLLAAQAELVAEKAAEISNSGAATPVTDSVSSVFAAEQGASAVNDMRFPELTTLAQAGVAKDAIRFTESMTLAEPGYRVSPNKQMQQRAQVISQFYLQATAVKARPLIQQV